MGLRYGDRAPKGVLSLVRISDGKSLAHGRTGESLAKLHAYFCSVGVPCEVRKRRQAGKVAA